MTGPIGATERGVAGWLRLAATPTFAAMALLSALPDGGQMKMLCSAASASSLSGMVPMYLLMSVFHLPPWLRLIYRGESKFLPSGSWAPMNLTGHPRPTS